MDLTSTSPTTRIDRDLDSLLVERPGREDRNIVAHSHFREPIPADDGVPHGNTRRWGDASPETQLAVIETLRAEASRHRLSVDETAFLLAIARVESGFNPDAAAGSSSASGIGQFIDRTGASYGLDASNRFSLRDNVSALVTHLKENLRESYRRVRETTQTDVFRMAYALHHDGPSLQYGGDVIAETYVLPWTERFRAWLLNRSVSQGVNSSH